ncbi:MAG TPA: TCP-1/cpn60 chaperonin family protein [Candidatus Bathyarchaeia archaeon]|nr:TCP-1/cpn60 chaperonin family protein [Candidatus Bathyarchaeia archaeon]
MTQQVGSAGYPVFRKDRERASGREAWTRNLSLASLAASKIQTCLGPKGAYKLVTYQRGPELVKKVTKDAVDVVDELGVQYPAIKTIAEAAKIQRQYVGDGVSTLLTLIAALLSEANTLIEDGVHPNLILDGFHQATKKSIIIINQVAKTIEGDLELHLLKTVDGGRDILNKNLQSALSEAIRRIATDGSIDVTRVGIITRPGGAIEDSRLVQGVIMKKEKSHPSMPDSLDAPRIALVTKSLGIQRLELLAKGEGPFQVAVNIRNAGQISEFKTEERRLRNGMVDRVKMVGANVLICRSKLSDKISDQLSRAGIFAVDMVDQKDLDEIARATGAAIVGDVNQLEKESIGVARKLEVDKLPPEHMVILHCDNGGTTFLLRGSSPEIIRELEKVVRNGLLILKHARNNSKVIPGGGAIFVALALQIRKYALTFPGKEQLAISLFANALEKIPECLARNYGLDPIDIMVQLHNHHSNDRWAIGVGEQGCADMFDMNIVELASVNKSTIERAFEVVSLLLRIDDYFYVKELPVFHKQ